MGNRDTRIGGAGVGTEVYAVMNDLQKTVNNALLAQGEGSGILVDLPTVDSSFTPIFEVDGDDIYVTLAFFIPGFTDELTVFTLDSTLVTNEATYNSKRKKYTIADISDADRAAQRIERRIEIPLKPQRLHYIPLLRAWEGDNRHDNPEDGFDFSGYPGNALSSFTTAGSQFDPANLTGLSLTITSATDPYTADLARIVLNFTQPATVVALKWVKLERKLTSEADSAYEVVTDPNKLSLSDDEFHTVGAKTVLLREALKTKPSRAYTLRVTIAALGLAQVQFTQVFVTDVNGAIASDTAAPVLPNAPVLRFKRGKLLAKMSMDGASQIATLKTVELMITDGTNSLNLDNLDSLVVASGLVYYQMGDAGTVHPIPISKQQLQTIFGSIAQLKCRFRLANVVGSTESAFSALINSLDTQTDYSPRTGYSNEIWNGDFTFDNGVTSTVMGNWQQYAPSDGGFSTITTTTASARWDQANHLYFWRVNDTTSTNKRFLVQNLFKTVVPGDFKSFSFFLSSDGSLTADVDVFLASLFSCTGTVAISSTVTPTKIIGTGTAFLSEWRVGSEVGVNNEIHVIQSVTNDTEAIMTTAALSTASGLTLFAATPQSEVVSITSRTYNTTETYIEVTVQVKTDLYTARDVYLCFRTPTTITSAAPFLRVGRVMQVSGKTSVQFARKVLYERNTSSTGLSAGVPAATENFSFVPTGGIGGDRQEPSGEPAAVGGYQAF